MFGTHTIPSPDGPSNFASSFIDGYLVQAISQEKQKEKGARNYQDLQRIVMAFFPTEFPVQYPKSAYEAIRRVSNHTNDVPLKQHMLECLRVALPRLPESSKPYQIHATNGKTYYFDRIFFRLCFPDYTSAMKSFSRHSQSTQSPSISSELWDPETLELLDLLVKQGASSIAHKKVPLNVALELRGLVDCLQSNELRNDVFSLVMNADMSDDDKLRAYAAGFSNGYAGELSEEIKADLARSVSSTGTFDSSEDQIPIKRARKKPRVEQVTTPSLGVSPAAAQSWGSLLRFLREQLFPWTTLSSDEWAAISTSILLSPQMYARRKEELSITGVVLRHMTDAQFIIRTKEDVDALAALCKDESFLTNVNKRCQLEELPRDLSAQERVRVYLLSLQIARQLNDDKFYRQALEALIHDTAIPRAEFIILLQALLVSTTKKPDGAEAIFYEKLGSKARPSFDELKGLLSSEQLVNILRNYNASFSLEELRSFQLDDSITGAFLRAALNARWLMVVLNSKEEIQPFLFFLTSSPLAQSISSVTVNFATDPETLRRIKYSLRSLSIENVVERKSQPADAAAPEAGQHRQQCVLL